MTKLQLDEYELAYEATSGNGTSVVFCPGFNSTMQGNKARDIKAFCLQQGHSFVGFDYSGHGQSGGDFADACVSQWLADTLAIIDSVIVGRVILVGSSMGAWIALLAALQRPERVSGLLLIACAADMTKFYQKRLDGLSSTTDHKSRAYYSISNQYDDQQPYRIYQKLIDDGEGHFLLDGPIDLKIDVKLIHGLQDDVVEWRRSEQVLQCLGSNRVSLLKVNCGDHRLSRPQDLARIRGLLSDLLINRNSLC
jgi:pimeloyl-ACP methyl ester carboxylesterase